MVSYSLPSLHFIRLFQSSILSCSRLFLSLRFSFILFYFSVFVVYFSHFSFLPFFCIFFNVFTFCHIFHASFCFISLFFLAHFAGNFYVSNLLLLLFFPSLLSFLTCLLKYSIHSLIRLVIFCFPLSSSFLLQKIY